METVPPPPKVCPSCAASVPPDAPEGLCPRCLAARNLLTGSLFAGAETRADAESAAAAAPTPEDLARFFPQLEIQRTLGRGGMGVVYLARQKSLDRLVALKLLAPERVDDPAFAARFAIEARALARLHHPHIVTVHDFGAAGGYYYLLMEYVDGLNLRQLQQAGRVEPREALAIVPQICEALQYAHDHGVVHRDIKPENILVDRLGRVKVADLGLAKLARPAASGGADDNRAAAECVVMGTPAYMSPEQKNHPDRVDHRTDIYALGAVLYEMLTGARPGTPPQNPSRDVRIDVRLDEVVLRALAHEPALRWQRASEVKTRLDTIAASPAGAPATKRRRALVIAALIGGLAVLALFKLKPGPWSVRTDQALAAGTPIDLAAFQTPRKIGGKDVARALATISGDHVFDGLGFHVDGQITLEGAGFKSRNPDETYPARVADIPIPANGRIFDELHLLHVTYCENPHGETVATLRLHYQDGKVAELPVRYGVHVRDWSLRPSEERERLDDPGSKVVFRDLKANRYGATARIIHTTFSNPRPKQSVRSLEIVASGGSASYSLLAATLALRDPARAITPSVPTGETQRDFDQEIVIHVVNGDTGAPVPGAQLDTSGTYRGARLMAEPLRTDANGEARLRFPRGPGDLYASEVGANLLATATHGQQWQSWEDDPPRIAYFFIRPVGEPRDDTEPLPRDLPSWRLPIARALLREHGEADLASKRPGRLDDATSLSLRGSFADLGALVQGTKGAVLFQAAMTKPSAPESSESQNLVYRDPEAYRLINGARLKAEAAFLRWVWQQVEPGSAEIPGPESLSMDPTAAFRDLDTARLLALFAEHEEIERRAPQPTGEPEEIARHRARRDANRDALFATLDGTELDRFIEQNTGIRIGDNPAIRPCVRLYRVLAAMIAPLVERGQTQELDLRIQQRDAVENMILRQLKFLCVSEGAGAYRLDFPPKPSARP
jgi:serine/threonine protein kinase